MNIRVSLFLATLTLSSVTLGLPALANAAQEYSPGTVKTYTRSPRKQSNWSA